MKKTSLMVIAILGALVLSVALVPAPAMAGHHSNWSVNIGGHGGGFHYGNHGFHGGYGGYGGYGGCYSAPIYYPPVYYPTPIYTPSCYDSHFYGPVCYY